MDRVARSHLASTSTSVGAELVDRPLELRPALDVFARGLLGVDALAAGGTKGAELAIKILMDR